MNSTDYVAEFDRCRQLVDRQLETYFTDERLPKELAESMRYSLLAGGKRIRPIIVLKFCEAVCGNMDIAIDFACAVEMLHTYSLIHDDLPCMDDDDFRRGKPANHMVFGECTATLAGDALQAAAFETILGAGLPAEIVVAAAKELGLAAGEYGICYGQILDMAGEGKNLSVSEIEKIHDLKTASMLVAAARMGAIAGGGAEDQVEAAGGYARALGLAFQIRDDILDKTATTDDLGKPVGSDEESDKSTFVSVYGIEKSERIIIDKTSEAKEIICGKFGNTGFLCWLADYLAKRKY